MSVSKIVEKIIGEATEEGQRIEEEARKRVEEIRKRATEEVQRIEAEAEERAQVEAREQRRRFISATQLELRKELLAERQHLIHQAFDLALQRLLELDGEEYHRAIKGLLLRAAEDGDEEVVVAHRDREKFTPQFLAEVNAELSAMGKRGNLRLCPENRDLVGGFVLKKGRREVNSSFSALLSSMREQLELEVAQLLFGQ